MAVQFRLDKLLEKRKEEGEPITQTELARVAGVTFATVNAIANNRTRQVHLDTLDALCRALKCDPGALFERDAKRRGKG